VHVGHSAAWFDHVGSHHEKTNLTASADSIGLNSRNKNINLLNEFMLMKNISFRVVRFRVPRRLLCLGLLCYAVRVNSIHRKQTIEIKIIIKQSSQSTLVRS
jgi:hypothetical protein